MQRAGLAMALTLAANSAAGDIALTQPVDCQLGTTCFIQNYVDLDPGPGYTDFTCGPLSYNGHKGTDFALPTLNDMMRGVSVLAAAEGVVTGVRDGMVDQLWSPETEASVAGRECGNGVVIDHGDGWVTQYCHMKKDSVAVQQGQSVSAGDPLGLIGLSGRTQFPHLHLSVRHNDAVVDPFNHASRPVCGADGDTLWTESIDYVTGDLITVAFAPDMPAFDRIKAGQAARDEMPSTAKALVLFAYGYGSRTGDQMTFTLNGPSGQIMTHTVTLEKTQAQYFRATGKRTPQGGWPKGTYQGSVVLIRDGAILSTRETTVSVR